MIAEGSVLTPGRLLVATLLLPDTISFQVPARDKDGRFKSGSKGSSLPNTAGNTTLSSSSAQPRPAASIHSLAAVDTSNGAMSDHIQRSIPPQRVAPTKMALQPTSILLPPLPTAPRFFRSTSSVGEAVTTVPKPITKKADRLKDQDRPALHQRASYHGHLATPPPSILAPPSDSKVGLGNVFPEAAPRPPLNQPRSRIGDHPTINIHKTQPHRRPSIDSAKVFAEAPWTVEKATSGNIGLHNAVNSIQGQLSKRIWIGTLGMATDTLNDRTRGDIKAELALDHSSIPVFVNDLDFEGHYHQFCKQILWPIFHYILPDNLRSKTYEDGSWKHYVAVNRAFADTIVENYRQGDTIWVNDYHLMLVPNMIRERLPDASIGFFLHIPFPSSEIFRCLHVRKEVLHGLLGADLVGFQTYSFARHFLQTCSRILAVESSPKGIQLENTAVNVGIFPIGIDTKSLNVKRQDPEVAQWVKVLKEKYAGMKLIVARDKLDYIKGVRQKMLAFERFLNLYPEWQGKIVLIQVALSTSEQNEFQGQVSDVVTRINSKFSSLSYQPIVFLRQDITFSQYLGLLTAADLCLITSLRDGMNLTSHEYIICQEETKNPLILSEFAGTYGSFGACLRINPWNYTEVAEAIHEGLMMKDDEKALRWNELRKHVCTNTAQFWATDFVSELIKVHGDVQRRYSIHIPLLNMQVVLPQFQSTKRRLLLLDYDGTLLPYERLSTVRTKGKTSHGDMIKVVTQLAKDPRNLVYIMSGRTRESLDEVFSGIENIGLCAEGGCFLKPVGKSAWEDQVQEGTDMQWRKKVMEMFEYYKERTPGSEIEEKAIPIVWHYRQADNPSYGLWQARECQNHIEEAIGSIYPIHAVVGRKCLEVMPRDVSKAHATKTIVETLRQQYGEDAMDFVLCIGDDRSDEDMFVYCNGLNLGDEHRVVTCTVGSKSSEARWFVPGVWSVLQGLQVMADVEQASA
ncbi:glycosyltransferase family 20-domain-containing protein [Gamsiella multidivaricata]|uniref:glycosyltransferase family 20-domain-containing protein n=1 Tax=Gamsiella multidivaricata TaxID=101098 RepID=UPI00221E8C94|nr:glycosyltransferase family 20-domain-containing protein [Gamsiella multidivaricata]KAI7829840.1 glycosyltransferase family 20-domain-containing protein [Gamsiella multidivaricata]